MNGPIDGLTDKMTSRVSLARPNTKYCFSISAMGFRLRAYLIKDKKEDQVISLLLLPIFRCVLATLQPGLSIRPSVRHAFVENKIFEQNIVRGGILGPLDASLNLYRLV